MRKVGDSSSSSSTRGAVPAIAGAALFFAQKQKHNKQPPSLRRAAVFLSILLFIDYLDLFFLADENHSSACAQCKDCQCSSDHAADRQKTGSLYRQNQIRWWNHFHCQTASSSRRRLPDLHQSQECSACRCQDCILAALCRDGDIDRMVSPIASPSRVRVPVAT